RFPGYPVRYLEVAVSGPGAAQALAEAVDRLDARPEIEVIVMARGGGDAAQLLPFSDEDLCRAIAASRTPVVTAIGHEGDRPLCDAVADLRCGTPSLAAAAVVPSRAELEQELDRLLSLVAAAALARLDHRARLLAAVDVGGTLAGRLAAAAGRVAVDGGRLQLLHPRRRTAGAAAAMARVDWERPVRARWARAADALAERRRTLDVLSPQRVLDRGYAVVRTPAGEVVRRAAQVSEGDELRVQLAAGRLSARVGEVREAADDGA
ncbi:MAG TPA: exodeoxyribonuclease VII large subunit, partial [Acidimicrobiales bacterium]|nr:exodeoxyribonuclease VII large subunit [Acidimicrobiales bacterium]